MRILAGAAWLCLAALGSAAEEPIDGWLPEGTLFCLSVEDAPRTAARLASGRYATLRGDAAAQRMLAETRNLLARAREASVEKGEVWLGPFWELARGRILLAVVEARNGEAPLVVMDVGDAAIFRRHLARLAEAGALGEEVVLQSGIRTRQGGEGAGAVFWIERQGVVAFSWREDAVEEVLKRGSQGLAPRLDDVRAKLRGDADLLLYLPRRALAELERRNTDVKSLGLADDAALGITIALDPDAIDVRAFLFAPSPRRGVLALLDGREGFLEPPPFLPQDTASFFAVRLDLASLPRLAKELLSKSEAAEFARLSDNDAAASFVRALGDEFVLAGVGRDQVLGARLEHEGWMRRFLVSATGQRGNVFEGRDGALAVGDGWLIAGPSAVRVRGLRGQDPATSLLAAPGYRRAVAGLPERRAMLWYLAPAPPRTWDDPTRLLAEQAGALATDADGLLVVHRILLR